jgi:hypothetical protein
MSPKQRSRRERAITLMESQVTKHESSVEFTKEILEGKNKLKGKSDEQIEKIRKTKVDRIKTCLENTKLNLR